MIQVVPYTKGSVKSAHYSCSPGYKLVGIPLRFCHTRFRHWHGIEPECAGNCDCSIIM